MTELESKLKELKKEYKRIKELAEAETANWYEYQQKRMFIDHANSLARAISILEGKDNVLHEWIWHREPHETVAYKVHLKIERDDGKQIDFNHYNIDSTYSGVTWSGGELAHISKVLDDVITGVVKTKETPKRIYI